MIHFYHGLFGSPEDWSHLIPEHSHVQLHDLYAENIHEVLNLKTSPQDILVGYSMGGRIALEIARRNHFDLRHLILLSAHPGLKDEEREDRRILEDEILSKMKSLSPDEFRSYWNNLSMFNSSTLKTDLTEKKLLLSAKLFDQLRLSQMPSCTKELEVYHHIITWIVGMRDSKYLGLILKTVSPLGIDCFTVDTDHRVLSAYQEIKNIFKYKEVL